MASPIALALIGGAIAGAGTAAVALVLMTPATQHVDPIQKVASEDWRADFNQLRGDNERLARRIEELEAQMSFAQASRSTPAEFVGADDEALQALVKEAVAGIQAEKPTEIAPVYLPDVEAALKIVEQQREQEREQRREQAMNERLEERLTELSGKIALAPNQVDSLRTTVTDYYKKSAEFFRQARDGGDFSTMRETMRQYRDDAEAAIKGALTPLQQQQYDEADISLLGFGRGGDFGGPGGDFGGGRGR